ncbi:MAG TPA: hypothetical protein VFQ12_11365 [Thermoleophilaceae bacterium]|nr:hypothetical protein [Thermoleophilaceae bacterium]
MRYARGSKSPSGVTSMSLPLNAPSAAASFSLGGSAGHVHADAVVHAHAERGHDRDQRRGQARQLAD